MKTLSEVVERIKLLFPLYQPVVFDNDEYIVLGVESHGTIDRLSQIALVSVKLGNTILNQPQFAKFARFKINLVTMDIAGIEMSEYPAHLTHPLDLAKNINSILKDEYVIY